MSCRARFSSDVPVTVKPLFLETNRQGRETLGIWVDERDER